jgi:hypothetical protein
MEPPSKDCDKDFTLLMSVRRDAEQRRGPWAVE